MINNKYMFKEIARFASLFLISQLVSNMLFANTVKAEFDFMHNDIIEILEILTNEPINDSIIKKNEQTHRNKKKHNKSQKNIVDFDKEDVDVGFYFDSHKWEDRKDVMINSIFGMSKQTNNADSIIRALDKLPSFGIYKDNYMLAGTELFTQPNKWNSDAKFQVSIRQRLSNSVLPFKMFLFLTYTQKAYWDIFQDSFPFRDLNYNPAIGLGRPLVYHNRFLGYLSLMLEHESNGRDGIDSRSWNKITLSSALLFHNRWMMEANLSIPFVDGMENKDIVKYMGWGDVTMEYTSEDRKYVFSATVNKRGGWNLNTNMTLSVALRLWSDSNQFLFFEYYNGYGENMLDYKVYRQRLRAGFVIKPKFLNFY